MENESREKHKGKRETIKDRGNESEELQTDQHSAGRSSRSFGSCAISFGGILITHMDSLVGESYKTSPKSFAQNVTTLCVFLPCS